MQKKFRFYFLIGVTGCVLALSSCGHAPFPESDHYQNGRFENLGHVGGGKSFWAVLRWKLAFSGEEWPEMVLDNVTPDFTQKPGLGRAYVTLINHATELLQFEGLTVLTDPVFSERVSPFSWIGPKRHRLPGATIAELPKVDVVVVSHNHYDHMDLASLLELERKDHPKFIVPLGNKKVLTEAGLTDVVELDWWQEVKLGSRGGDESGSGNESGTIAGEGTRKRPATISLVPMQHWSRRGLGDTNEALWGGYVIQASGLKVLFAGDTGYGEQFKLIEQKFGSMDLSLLPIGAYEPRWFMKAQHMNPEDSVRAHLDLKSRRSIGMHFGTFQLTDERIEEPVTALRENLVKAKIPENLFAAPKNGQTVSFGL